MTSILPEILAPPRIATNGRFGLASALPRYSSSFSIRRPATAGCRSARDALGGRVRAVRRAERVVHVEVAERRERLRQARRRSFPRRRGSACSRAAATSPSCETLCRRDGVVAVGASRRSCTGRFGSVARGVAPPARASTSRPGSPLGRPRCESRTTRAPRSQQVLDRRQRGADPRVVGDAAVALERDVEVDAHERALAAQLGRREDPRSVFLFMAGSGPRGEPPCSRQADVAMRPIRTPTEQVDAARRVAPLVVVPAATPSPACRRRRWCSCASRMHECGLPM